MKGCTCRPRRTGPSSWRFALPIIAYGLIYSLWLCLVGGLVAVAAIYGWALEPPDDPDGDHGDHHGPDDHSAAGESTEVDEGATTDAVDADKEVETVG